MRGRLATATGAVLAALCLACAAAPASGEERRLAEQPLVPRSGRLELPHAQTREEMQRHRRESRSRGGWDSVAFAWIRA